MNRILGLMPAEFLTVMLVGGVAGGFLGVFWGLGSVTFLTGIFHYREYRRTRPEAAWEITENGTKLLWDDGPKEMKQGGSPVCRMGSRFK